MTRMKSTIGDLENKGERDEILCSKTVIGFSRKFVSWFSALGPFSTGIMVRLKSIIQGVVKPSL